MLVLAGPLWLVKLRSPVIVTRFRSGELSPVKKRLLASETLEYLSSRGEYGPDRNLAYLGPGLGWDTGDLRYSKGVPVERGGASSMMISSSPRPSGLTRSTFGRSGAYPEDILKPLVLLSLSYASPSNDEPGRASPGLRSRSPKGWYPERGPVS